MIHHIKLSAARAGDTIIGDAVGAFALAVMLVGALYLPAFF
ncbi:MAG: hypothetical protein ACU0B5_15480 [Roseovarius sp.]